MILGMLFACARLQHVELREVDTQLTPSRPDVTVSTATVIVRCVRRAGVLGRAEACADFEVDGVVAGGSLAYVALEPVGDGRFLLEAHQVNFSDTRDAFLCLALKAELNEVSNRCDSDFYTVRGDRYSLVSWCSVSPQPTWADPHIYQYNSVETLEEFLEAIEGGLDLHVKDGALEDYASCL